MKTLKVALVLAMVSFAMMGFSKDLDRQDQNKQIYELKSLLNKPLFVNAIYAQVNPTEFLTRDNGDRITVKIMVHKKVYEVVGSYSEWKSFFSSRQILPFFKKNNREHKSR